MRGRAAIARRLLDAGANRGAQDANGRTPGDWAVLHGWRDVAAVLNRSVPDQFGAEAQPLAANVLETRIKVVDVMTPLPRRTIRMWSSPAFVDRSALGSDWLSGRSPFELRRAEVADAGMASAGIVESFDVIEDRHACLGVGAPPVAVDHLAFE